MNTTEVQYRLSQKFGSACGETKNKAEDVTCTEVYSL